MSESEAVLDLEDDFIYGHEKQAEASTSHHGTGGYICLGNSGFKVFHLKPELLRAVVDCGFKHPSTVQNLILPQAILGMNVMFQGRHSGKIVAFVLATLQQLDPVENQVSVLVMTYTPETAIEISENYKLFSKYSPNIKVGVFYRGMNIATDVKILKTNCPHIVVGTADRLIALVNSQNLILSHIKHLVIYECDKLFEACEIRIVFDMLKGTPMVKQVLIFSSSINTEMRPICKKLMRNEKVKPAAAITHSAKTALSKRHGLVDCDEVNQDHPTQLRSETTETLFKLNSLESGTQLVLNLPHFVKFTPKTGYKRYISDSDSYSDSDD